MTTHITTITENMPANLIDGDDTIHLIDKQITKLMKQVIPKRRRFIREYMKDWNGTQACIRAGYAVKSAQGTSSLIMGDSTVQTIVQLLEEKHQLETGISASWKRKQLKNIIEATQQEGDGYQPGTACKAINELNLMDGGHKPKQHHVTSESVSVNLNYQIDMPTREGGAIEGEVVNEDDDQ